VHEDSILRFVDVGHYKRGRAARWREWVGQAEGAKGGCIYNRRVQADENSQIILAENLVKVYAAGKLEVSAVRGVSLEVKKGEFVAIVGPSGSGKSTLFYLLGGLTRASAGRVVIDGVDFATLDDAERTKLRKHRIGFVFQKFNLLPTLSAMGNIEIAYEISGRKEPLDRGYLDHLSDMLSISGRLKHRPAELSGGEQQRVAIARALVTKPAIVLADEPTGNLDTQNSEAVLHMLMRSNRELGQTTLMITHNPEARPWRAGFCICATGRLCGRKRVRGWGGTTVAGSGSTRVKQGRERGKWGQGRGLTQFRRPGIL